MNNYAEFLADFLTLLDAAKRIPLGHHEPINWPELAKDAPVAMMLFAHPDDEWLSGMPLGLRLRREGYRLIVVPVTLGRPDQYERRLKELSAACCYGGMHIDLPGNKGKGLRDQMKQENGGRWEDAVSEIEGLIRKYNPNILITHHENDGHHDHIAVSTLAHEALSGAKADCYLVETEYWNDLDPPNFQLEISETDVAQVLNGASFHEGEMRRNPFHLMFPLLGMLNAQYAERVTGWGKPAAPFRFSVMLRLRRVRDGKLEVYNHPPQLSATEPLSLIFPTEQ